MSDGVFDGSLIAPKTESTLLALWGKLGATNGYSVVESFSIFTVNCNQFPKTTRYDNITQGQGEKTSSNGKKAESARTGTTSYTLFFVR